MSVKLITPSARSRTVRVKIPANTAFAVDTAVSPSDNNSSDPVAATTASSNTIDGIITKAITATQYASDTWVDVLRDEDGIYEFTTSGADVNDEGGLVDFADATSLDVTTSTKDHVRVTRYISATKVAGKIDKWS